jgi:hypothetical protein
MVENKHRARWKKIPDEAGVSDATLCEVLFPVWMVDPFTWGKPSRPTLAKLMVPLHDPLIVTLTRVLAAYFRVYQIAARADDPVTALCWATLQAFPRSSVTAVTVTALELWVSPNTQPLSVATELTFDELIDHVLAAVPMLTVVDAMKLIATTAPRSRTVRP